MAKLYFRYGAMNSGKSTLLMQVAYNYEERGMHVLLLKPGVDTKGGNEVVSRLGVRRRVDRMITPDCDVRRLIAEELQKREFHCILIDEAQFLSEAQVDQLFITVLDSNIPCICYGLRSDFRGEGFPGSNRLLQLAHSLEELKTICRCGRKAIMNIRRINSVAVFEGDQIVIDDQDIVEYEAVCGQCYLEARRSAGKSPLQRIEEDPLLFHKE
ncbi:MAG: thymidine kinase [Peptoniphilaceae bacterium]|nr:thymidine kinase [Peptoniphilaceae bacterium]MDY4196956.1 thymidine kinase [Peptoniphilaceae bacterium]MDY5841351.1 thymidine kinase [Peptoniphilaceae bacterium]MDY6146011.1 thymidine kinase [Peptoniphilaceae bacterium]